MKNTTDKAIVAHYEYLNDKRARRKARWVWCKEHSPLLVQVPAVMALIAFAVCMVSVMMFKLGYVLTPDFTVRKWLKELDYKCGHAEVKWSYTQPAQIVYYSNYVSKAEAESIPNAPSIHGVDWGRMTVRSNYIINVPGAPLE
jgi:hypothetical protein